MSIAWRIRSVPLLAGALVIAGCSSGSSSAPVVGGPVAPPLGALATGGASSLFVVQQAAPPTSTVLQFATNSNTAAIPAMTYSTATLSAQAVAVDRAGRLYIGSGNPGVSGSSEIFEYSAPPNQAAVRTILGTAANPLGIPQSIAVDASGQVYVLTQDGNVLIYDSTNNSTSVPVRTISGQATQIVTPLSLAVDAAGNVYVASASLATTGTILVFAPTANGNVAPTRVITNPNIFYGLAVDSSQNLYAVLNTVGGISTSIVEYTSTASGAATPTKTIAGALTGLNNAYGFGLQLDAANNVWISTGTPVNSNERANPTIIGFNPQASGNFPSGATVASSNWTSSGAVLALR